MPLPSENSLRIKVGLIPHRKFVCNKDSDNDDDDVTWKPNKSKPTQSRLISMKLIVQLFYVLEVLYKIDQ